MCPPAPGAGGESESGSDGGGVPAARGPRTSARDAGFAGPGADEQAERAFLRCMQRLPIEQILALQDGVAGGDWTAWAPVVDGELIRAGPVLAEEPPPPRSWGPADPKAEEPMLPPEAPTLDLSPMRTLNVLLGVTNGEQSFDPKVDNKEAFRTAVRAAVAAVVGAGSGGAHDPAARPTRSD